MSREEDIQHQFNLLEINRRNATHLQRQADSFGANLVPMNIASELNNTRANIVRIKKALWEYYNVSAESAPIDDARPLPPSSPSRPELQEDSVMVLLRDGLNTLEQLIVQNRNTEALQQIKLLRRISR